ncbi:MAG TPA: hypothetical protein VHC96_18140, partial [Puia sp.]|nr:hypothetical protein [Puia sp.]
MLILLDCRPLQKAGASGETSWFIITCVKELTARHGVQWIFLLDKGEEGLALPADGKQLVRRTLPGRLGDELWYSWLMPRMARREKVDLVMTGGEGLKTRGTSGAIKMSETNRAIKMSERNKAIKMSETNKPIKTPLCVWEMSEKGLVFSAGETEVRVPLAPDEEVRSLSAEEREKWKEETAGGREYFFADVTGLRTSKVVNLLKAFSLFKKRQLSNMRLVLAGAGTIDKLDSYKYREDICLFPGREKGSMEAAYAVIHIPRRNDPGIAVLNAWRAKAPVIMLANGAKAAKSGNGTKGAKAAKGVNEAKAA